MKTLAHVLVAGTALAAVAAAWSFIPTAAIGADLYKAPTPAQALPATWNRVYLGVNLGYGWNDTGVNLDVGGVPVDLGSVPHGLMGGGQFGFDTQLSPYLVFGGFCDIDAASLRSSGQVASVITANNVSNFLGSCDARVGVAIGNHSLLFVNGGLGWATNDPHLASGTLQAAASGASVGWDIGGGLETKFPALPGWSGFIRGGFEDVGAKSLTLPGGLVTSNNPLQFGYVKIGINYAIIGQ